MFNLNSQNSPVWLASDKTEVIAAYRNACNWFMNTQSYAFEIKYTSYKTHTSNEIIESSIGYYKRSEKKYITDAVGIRTIQNEKIRMVIDTTDKVIAVSNPSSLTPGIQNADELNKLFDNVKTLRKKTILKSVTYRIDFKKNELYEAYEFTVGEKGYLEKLVYCYSEQIEKDYGDGENEKQKETKIKPRMEITFYNYLVPAKVNESEFTDRSIVLAANNKVSLINKYKTYTLKDYRLQGK